MADGYQDHISLKVLKLLEIKLSHKILSFYDGKIDMKAISKYDLPLLFIELLSSETGIEGTGTVRDAERLNFQVTVVIDRRDAYDNKLGKGEQEFNSMQKDLQNLVEERDSTNAIQTNTVKGVIRDNIQLDSEVLYTENVKAEYSDYINEAEFPLAKAVVQFSAYLRTTR